MKIICDECGIEFRRKTCLSEFNRYPNHFCSTKCVGKYRGKHTGNTKWDKKSYQKVNWLNKLRKMMESDKKALEGMF